MTGTLTNAPPGEIQEQHRPQLVHRDAAIVATKNMAQDRHLAMVPKTRRSKYRKQQAIGCESIHIGVDDVQRRI